MYKYSKKMDAFYPNDIDYLDLPDDLIAVDSEQYTKAIANRDAGGMLDVSNEKLILIEPAPSPAYEYDAKKQLWVLNKDRQAELEAQAQAQAIDAAVAGVTDALSAAIAAKFGTLNDLIGANFKSQDTFMTYAGFSNAFQKPAQAFGAWTSSVWSEANEYKKQVFAGKKPMLSPVEAVALMPDFDMSEFE